MTETTTSSDTLAKAQALVGKLFRGKQESWPEDMYIMVKVGDIRDIQSVLGAAIEQDANALGARRKDV